MASERLIKTKFWTDSYIVTLAPNEKLLFLYFLTNPLTNISGVYEITMKQVVFDTQLNEKFIYEALKKFEKDKKVIYKNNWIRVVNFVKNQNFSRSDSVVLGIKRELEKIPEDIKKMLKMIENT